MKIETISGQEERSILIGMIVDDSVVGRIAVMWTGKEFRSRWSNLIAGWCVVYYERYKAAPGKQVESLFSSWASKSKEEATVDLVETFLSGLSDEYDALRVEANSDFVVDLAGEHFNKIKMERLIRDLEGDVQSGDVSGARERVNSYSHIEVGAGAGIDPMQSEDAVRDAFKKGTEDLIEYPGALGEFLRHQMGRDCFIAFTAPEKRGKSFWLLDVAYRAMVQRRKVAFFDAGDNSQDQVMRRLMARVTQHPIWPGEVRHPIEIERDEGSKTADVVHRPKVFKRKLTWRRAWRAVERLKRHKIKSEESYLRMSFHPNLTLSIRGIREILKGWGREGWTPDVLVLDYADIFDMFQAHLESRDQINEVWQQLRRLSQELHCLVVTATQADADSYKREIIQMGNFSGDKRKNAHPTGIIGINQTLEEKEQGIYRLNWVVRREGMYSTARCVHVASNLGYANPAVLSTF